MNNTNRALNRILVAVIGFLAIVIGAGLVAVGAVPVVRDGYQIIAPALHEDFTSWMGALPLFDTGISWYWVFALVFFVLIVVILLVLIFRQGHGHEQTLLREEPTPAGTTIIDAAVAEQTIQDALDGRPELLTSRVSTYTVRKTPVLKVSVTCRRGVSPRDVTHMIENTLTAFDHVFGREIPALIQISGGFRARLAKTTRTH